MKQSYPEGTRIESWTTPEGGEHCLQISSSRGLTPLGSIDNPVLPISMWDIWGQLSARTQSRGPGVLPSGHGI